MSDKIIISNLVVFARHGVFEEENRLGQKFVISAELFTDTRLAGKTDNLEYSVHYGEAAAFIKMITEQNTYMLVERLAEEIAEKLLLKYPIKKVKIKVEKPWAPVGLMLDTVAVEIERGWHSAYIALGSNMGDRKAHIDNAISALKNDGLIRVSKVSSFIETEPYGGVEQENFLNGCMEINTLYTPMELLDVLHMAENAEKRERLQHWGPRTLDLDIIFYDDAVIDLPELTIPHADMKNRQFVLGPLKEIAPCKRHPVLNKTVNEMYNDLILE